MALRGKTLSNMMSGANKAEVADVSESVSFIGDGKKRKRVKQSKKARANTPNRGFRDRCFNPNM